MYIAHAYGIMESIRIKHAQWNILLCIYVFHKDNVIIYSFVSQNAGHTGHTVKPGQPTVACTLYQVYFVLVYSVIYLVGRNQINSIFIYKPP